MRTLALLVALALHAAAAVTIGALELAPGWSTDDSRVLALSLGSADPSAAIESAGTEVARDDVREAPLPVPVPCEEIVYEIEDPPLSPDLEELIALPPEDVPPLPPAADPLKPLAEGRLPLKQGPSHEPQLGVGGNAPAAGREGGDSANFGVDGGAEGTAGAPATPAPPSARGAAPEAGSEHSDGSPATLVSPAPAYPRSARLLHQEGEVVFLALVKADGTVDACEIESSSGHDVLDDAARAALLRWKFRPRIVDGIARPFTARVPFRFKIPPPRSR